MRRLKRFTLVWAACATLTIVVPARAHDGPPYPIVSNQVSGPYRISLWTDPDATDDGSSGGQFWVMVDMAGGDALPGDLRARVSIRPLSRAGQPQSADTEPMGGDGSRRFVALLMDHEGPFSVQVTVEGASGSATIESRVEATYDLRPPPIMLVIYAVRQDTVQLLLVAHDLVQLALVGFNPFLIGENLPLVRDDLFLQGQGRGTRHLCPPWAEGAREMRDCSRNFARLPVWLARLRTTT
jgi:hypothetical protein